MAGMGEKQMKWGEFLTVFLIALVALSAGKGVSVLLQKQGMSIVGSI